MLFFHTFTTFLLATAFGMLYTARICEASGAFYVSLRKGTGTRTLADITH